MTQTIDTGDAILVRTAHSILGRLTQILTRSPYTHAGVAIWVGGRLYMAELNGGRNHLVPMTQLTQYDVYACPDGLQEVERAILGSLAQPIDYGYPALVLIGVLNWFRIKLFVHWRKVIVCSGFVVAVYEAAGWPECSRVVSPEELSKQLTMKFQVNLL